MMKLNSSELVKYQNHIEFDTLVDERLYAQGKNGIRGFVIRIAGRICLTWEEANKFNINSEENKERYAELIEAYYNAEKIGY